MKRFRRGVQSIGLALFLLGIVIVGVEGAEIIEAFVDRDVVYVNEDVHLTIIVNTTTQDASTPTLPQLGPFHIVAESSGSQVSILNGDMSTQEYYQITLRATEVGDYVIDPISISVGRDTYFSDPIAIRVEPGSRPANQRNSQSQINPFQGLPGLQFGNIPSIADLLSMLNTPALQPQLERRTIVAIPTELQGQDIYLESTLEKDGIFQGEQAVYTIRLFQAVETLLPPEIHHPPFSGFWVYEDELDSEYIVSAAGRDYVVHEREVYLFPTVVGEVQIEPSQVILPSSAFFGGGTLEGDRLALSVSPLPQPVPDDFSGAVGEYELTVEVDTREIDLDGSVTLQAILSGIGNIDSAAEPGWIESTEWRSFDSSVERYSQIENNEVIGVLVSERVLVPTASGQLTIPPLQYTYFNPVTEQYETIDTSPIAINVTGDPSLDIIPPGNNLGSTETTDELKTIHPLNLNIKAASMSTPTLTDQVGYWAMWMLPILLIGGMVTANRIMQHRSDTSAERVRHQAAKVAKSELRKISKMENGVDYAIERVFIEFLEKKLHRPIQGLSVQEVGSVLEKGKAPTHLVNRVLRLLADLETMRYAPCQESDLQHEYLRLVDELIKELDTVLLHEHMKDSKGRS